MTYLRSNNYNIIPVSLTEMEKKFIKKTNSLFNTQPLKWFEVYNEIIHNKEIVYFRDTTMIISLYKLNKIQSNNLFELLKIFLREGAFEKLIYKKEFMIINFATKLIGEIFVMKDSWMVIDYYYQLCDILGEEKVFYKAMIQTNDHQYHTDLIVYNNQNVSVINLDKQYNYDFSSFLENNKIFYYELQLFNKKKSLNDKVRIIKYYFSKEMQLKTLCNYFTI